MIKTSATRENPLKKFTVLALLLLTVGLSGCAAPVVEGAMQARDSLRRDGLEQAAAAVEHYTSLGLWLKEKVEPVQIFVRA
jgi:hypothetical protein